MAKRSKTYLKTKEKRNRKEHTLEEAVKAVKSLSYSKFVGTVEMHLVVDLPKDKDPKSIKGSIALPYSAGKTKTVYVFTSPENSAKAEAAGADKVGLEDLIKEVQSAKAVFDVAIATPDVMAKIAILGKELGPKGLMPNPKTGTVASPAELEETVKAYKKGKQTFGADEQGGIHMNVGKIDLEEDKLIENINKAVSAVEEVFGKSASQLVRIGYLAPTMGPSVAFKFAKPESE
ncbi:50S ribosomal protein L1 [bacterium]|nr:50S ribosomal protein L1 [bacterium]